MKTTLEDHELYGKDYYHEDIIGNLKEKHERNLHDSFPKRYSNFEYTKISGNNYRHEQRGITHFKGSFCDKTNNFILSLYVASIGGIGYPYSYQTPEDAEKY